MEHSFNVELAKEYGILEAILLKSIFFWIEKNKANNRHFYDGKYWTYNSIKAFNELFPYASEKTIRRTLNGLIEKEILITGNYNKNCYDRTLWYAFTEKGNSIITKKEIDLPIWANGNTETGEPIPYNIPYKETDIKENIKRKKAMENFEIFYQAYPRKVGKANVEKWFNKNKPNPELFDKIIRALEEHKELKQWQDKQYIPHPSTWLNQKRWEDELEDKIKITKVERRYNNVNW